MMMTVMLRIISVTIHIVILLDRFYDCTIFVCRRVSSNSSFFLFDHLYVLFMLFVVLHVVIVCGFLVCDMFLLD